MPNEDGSKNDRKNMNLSLRIFKMLVGERRLLERKVGVGKLPWDLFFEMYVKEVKRGQRPSPAMPRRKAAGR